MDRLGLLDKLTEDENFGNFVFSIAGRQVSRDLLDSVAEIYFLDRHLGLGSRVGFRVLDVGAGYGRLAHRMVSAIGGVERYYCTDAVAVSTFVSEYYLRFRNADRAVVIPLDEIEAALSAHPVDLAINVSSFPECRMQAIEWWIRLLSRHRVKNLMIVANSTTGRGEHLLTSEGQDFLPLLEQYGYRTVVKEPKYLDPVVQEFGLYPNWHHLLELRG
jgi:putative sugar O-methyltransferase